MINDDQRPKTSTLGAAAANAHFAASKLPQTDEWVAVVRADAIYRQNSVGGRWSDCVFAVIPFLEKGKAASPMARSLLENL